MAEVWRIGRASVRNWLIGIILASSAGASQPADWKIETIDTSGAGKFASLKFDNDGNGHLAYVAEDGNYTLKYSYWDHALKRWFTMPIAGGASFSTLVLDSKQRPCISWADHGAGLNSKLRYASWDGKTWRKQAIPLPDDVIGFYTSLVVDAKDNPTLSFYEYEGPKGVGFLLKLRTVTWNGSYWAEHTIDSAPGSGKFNSLAMGNRGYIQAAYANVKDENASLRYAVWDGTSWKHEVLEGTDQAFYVYSVALAVDNQNTPHITYTDVRRGLIKYATRHEGKWRLEVVDSIVKEAYPDRNGIAVDSSGNPYMSYYDAGAGMLKLAHKRGGKWVSEVVDNSGAGFTSSIQIQNGQIWIVYADENQGTLKCASKALSDETDSSGAWSQVSQRSGPRNVNSQ
jgi:hypothetical protein